MIKQHIDEQGNTFYTRKELESNDEAYLAIFAQEYMTLAKLIELFTTTLSDMNINADTEEESLPKEAVDYVHEMYKIIEDKYKEMLDIFYVDVVISEEELTDIMTIKNDNTDVSIEDRVKELEKLLLNNNK